MKFTRTQKKVARFIIATLLLIVYIWAIFPFYQNIDTISKRTTEEISELTKPPEPYTYQIPLYFSFNGSSPFMSSAETDFGFLLTLTYPNGTLVPNEIVDINITAVMDNVVTSLDHVAIIFPNALSYPISYGENGFPIQAIVSFQNPYNLQAGIGNIYHNNYFEGDCKAIWIIDGDYTPVIGFFFKDGTNKIYQTTNFVIHVYPKEQLTQLENSRVSLENNQASLELSKAVFWLSTVAIIALFIQIIDHSDNECYNPKNQPNKQEGQPPIKQEQTQQDVTTNQNASKTTNTEKNANPPEQIKQG